MLQLFAVVLTIATNRALLGRNSRFWGHREVIRRYWEHSHSFTQGCASTSRPPTISITNHGTHFVIFAECVDQRQTLLWSVWIRYHNRLKPQALVNRGDIVYIHSDSPSPPTQAMTISRWTPRPPCPRRLTRIACWRTHWWAIHLMSLSLLDFQSTFTVLIITTSFLPSNVVCFLQLQHVKRHQLEYSSRSWPLRLIVRFRLGCCLYFIEESTERIAIAIIAIAGILIAISSQDWWGIIFGRVQQQIWSWKEIDENSAFGWNLAIDSLVSPVLCCPLGTIVSNISIHTLVFHLVWCAKNWIVLIFSKWF